MNDISTERQRDNAVIKSFRLSFQVYVDEVTIEQYKLNNPSRMVLMEAAMTLPAVVRLVRIFRDELGGDVSNLGIEATFDRGKGAYLNITVARA
jgi:hypothetical protein